MKKITGWISLGLASLLFFGALQLASAEDAKPKKIVLVAGRPSHGPGDHEFRAGCLLLKKCLDQIPTVKADIHFMGWPEDDKAFEGADAIVLYMDGGSGHPVIQKDHLKLFEGLMSKGVGLACLHYAVEVPKEKGGPDFLKWIGGYYETGYSINPHWEADLNVAKDHPITRGVTTPWKIQDEWYYTMRFPTDTKNITAILRGTPPDQTRTTDETKAHPGREETLSWAIERPDGGRGFGFTGGHFHRNWGNDNFRKLVLNAILWTAKAEVPEQGVQCAISDDDVKQNLDPKPKR